MDGWLAQPHEFSQHITSISLSSDLLPYQQRPKLHSLPYPALQSLRLQGGYNAVGSRQPMFIALGPHADMPGILTQCSDLLECVLDSCDVPDTDFHALTNVTKLTSLTLRNVDSYKCVYDLRAIKTLKNLQQLCLGLGALLPSQAILTRQPYQDFLGTHSNSSNRHVGLLLP